MKDKLTLDDEEIRQHEHDFRIAVEATANMLDKLEPDSPETFYGSLTVVIHELFTHAPSLTNAMDIISIVIQDNISEKDFNKYFKKAFRTDPFFAKKERTLH